MVSRSTSDKSTGREETKPKSAETATRVAIIGAGPMGRLHARTISRVAKNDESCVLSRVMDHHPGRAQTIAAEFGATASADLEEAIRDVDAVVVCVPTSAHFSLTADLLERGLDVLVEKPLAASVAEAKELAVLADSRSRILQVGHVEWYNQGWRDAARKVGIPTKIEVERLNPPSDRGLDVDVVADFMLHDLDWVTRLMNEEVVSVCASGRCVVNEKYDEAEAELIFQSGCRARLRASRISREQRRFVRIFGKGGSASADLLLRCAPDSSATGEANADPLEAQWRDFLRSVRSREAPEADAQVGVAALQVVARVREAIERGSRSPVREDGSALGG